MSLAAEPAGPPTLIDVALMRVNVLGGTWHAMLLDIPVEARSSE